MMCRCGRDYHWGFTVREGSLVYQILTRPLWHSRDIRRVRESRYAWALCSRHTFHPRVSQPACYVLRPLGILHKWTGFVIYRKEAGRGPRDGR